MQPAVARSRRVPTAVLRGLTSRSLDSKAAQELGMLWPHRGRVLPAESMQPEITTSFTHRMQEILGLKTQPPLSLTWESFKEHSLEWLEVSQLVVSVTVRRS